MLLLHGRSRRLHRYPKSGKGQVQLSSLRPDSHNLGVAKQELQLRAGGESFAKGKAPPTIGLPQGSSSSATTTTTIMSSWRDSNFYRTISTIVRGPAATSGVTSEGNTPPDVSACSPTEVHRPLADWVAEATVGSKEHDERLIIAHQRCYEKGCVQAHYPC